MGNQGEVGAPHTTGARVGAGMLLHPGWGIEWPASLRESSNKWTRVENQASPTLIPLGPFGSLEHQTPRGLECKRLIGEVWGDICSG